MTDTELLKSDREKVVDYLRTQLIGPIGGPDEKLPVKSPAPQRYMMGTLFPQETDLAAVTEGEEDGSGQSMEDAGESSPVSLAYSQLPASIGISFYVSGSGRMECGVYGAVYRKVSTGVTEDVPGEKTVLNKVSFGVTGKVKGEAFWQRFPLASEESPELLKIEPPSTLVARYSVLSGNAILHALWRRRGNGFIVTVTLMNAKKSGSQFPDYEDCISQAGFFCRPLGGEILAYPVSNRMSLDEEEDELTILYRDRITYAVGHGCAAEWDGDTGGEVTVVRTEFMPGVVVPGITADVTTKEGKKESHEVLRLVYLKDEKVKTGDLVDGLNAFVNEYATWVRNLPAEHTDIQASLHPARDRMLSRMDEAVDRMRRGIGTIEKYPQVRKAFCLANRAMLMQMLHYGGKAYAATVRDRNSKKFISPDYNVAGKDFRWRPFQLAFMLLTLESVVNHESDDREKVDLIWFPTGGGKTEAYLTLAAFEIFFRRIRDGEKGEGTAVIKRYTLRLLTSQQFQRAATLVCACEMIRKEENLGGPMSLGLWVGDEVTPNKFADAKVRYEEMRDANKPENPFQLQNCPWCGTSITPAKHHPDPANYGVEVKSDLFRFYCPSDDCPFHQRIPVTVVDEDMFQNPPTFIIGTIDKFARITWDYNSTGFFGTEARLPPSLIIQDELHLISGPLGTIAGIYEAAIDTIISERGARPKLIAATATIRRAPDQVRLLYGRDVAVFPPAGLSAEDSFFARTDKSVPGRLYLGVMGQGHTPVYSLVQTSAALSQAAEECSLSPKAYDGYWTQVIFHNSRRELGKTMTLARDDIPARIKIIATDHAKMRKLDVVEELSANVSGKRIPEILNGLGTAKVRGGNGAIDILPCTNMLSVGVDVKRLGLMMVFGQPKTTAEYIQASSRVGRDVVPGLVVAFYSASKPRDRSHYEGFRPYHEALYRAVEPTSVTPYAIPARERALHAALVAVMRMAGGLDANDKARNFNPDNPATAGLITRFRKRISFADPDSAAETAVHIARLADNWTRRIALSVKNGAPLLYSATGGNQFTSLLCTFEERINGAWPTLNSMRNVDSECIIYVRGE